MKILHLTSHMNIGGITSYILSLSGEQKRRGHSVAIASGGGQHDSTALTYGITNWELALHTSVEFSPQVHSAKRSMLLRLNEDPVHLIHAHTRVGQVVADWLSKQLKIPYITTWHGFFRPNIGRRLWPCTGDLTIAISEPVRQHLLDTFHVPDRRIRLIPHGIDTGTFEQPVKFPLQQGLRDELSLPRDVPIVGTVSRLVASKGVDVLIRSLKHIRTCAGNVHLVIVGDGPERSRLTELARREGVAGFIHFAGALPETRVALSIMSVFVFMPADKEGFGLSLLEAMASGLPIVALKQGKGASWVLEQSGIGMTVEPQDPAELGVAVVKLLQDKAMASDAGKHLQMVAKERYSLSRMVDNVECCYQELIGSS